MPYHPQDLVAVGLALAGLACVLRGKWVWAGVLVGLAISSRCWFWRPLSWRLLGAAPGAYLLVTLPVDVAGRATSSPGR